MTKWEEKNRAHTLDKESERRRKRERKFAKKILKAIIELQCDTILVGFRVLFVHIIMATFKLSLFIQKSGTINFNLVHFWRNRDLKKFFSLVCCFGSRRYTFFSSLSDFAINLYVFESHVMDGFCTTMTIYILCTTTKTLPGKSQRTRDEKKVSN